MEWSRDFPPQIKCTKCGYTVYPKSYEPDCIKLPETLEEYFELCEKTRRKMDKIKPLKPCPDGETQCCICCDKQGGCDNRCDMMDSYEYAEECEDYVEEDES